MKKILLILMMFIIHPVYSLETPICGTEEPIIENDADNIVEFLDNHPKTEQDSNIKDEDKEENED